MCESWASKLMQSFTLVDDTFFFFLSSNFSWFLCFAGWFFSLLRLLLLLLLLLTSLHFSQCMANSCVCMSLYFIDVNLALVPRTYKYIRPNDESCANVCIACCCCYCCCRYHCCWCCVFFFYPFFRKLMLYLHKWWSINRHSTLNGLQLVQVMR